MMNKLKAAMKALQTWWYERKCKSFKFIINPHNILERYVIHKGVMYRVVFAPEGVSVTDQDNEFVECQLTRLKILKQVSKEF